MSQVKWKKWKTRLKNRSRNLIGVTGVTFVTTQMVPALIAQCRIYISYGFCISDIPYSQEDDINSVTKVTWLHIAKSLKKEKIILVCYILGILLRWNPRQLPSRFANKRIKGSAAAWHSDYRGVVEKLHRRRRRDSFQEGASDVIMSPF